MEQRSEAWFKERAGKLTGSNFAAALGLSPYKSRQALWRELTGRAEPDTENAAMRHGTRCEPLAIGWYEEQTGEIVTPVGFVPHPKLDWCGVSPDGYVGRGRIEVKCPASGVPHESIPDHYMPQCVGVLHITGADFLDFVSWCPDRANVFRITAKETLEQWQKWEKQLEQFWNDYIIEDVCPPRKKNGKA
jgi:putative phage-type endonuclease